MIELFEHLVIAIGRLGAVILLCDVLIILGVAIARTAMELKRWNQSHEGM